MPFSRNQSRTSRRSQTSPIPNARIGSGKSRVLRHAISVSRVIGFLRRPEHIDRTVALSMMQLIGIRAVLGPYFIRSLPLDYEPDFVGAPRVRAVEDVREQVRAHHAAVGPREHAMRLLSSR